MSIDFTVRSPENEIMDDFEMSGENLLESLDQIAKINKWLGGDKITLNGVNKLIRQTNSKPIKIIDIGCGGGEMCRQISKWATKKQLFVEIMGIDANENTIDYAKEQSKEFKNVSYQTANVFDPAFDFGVFDIALCTLTLHHFSDPEIKVLMKQLHEKVKVGIVINDLHRSWLAYQLYQIVGTVFQLSDMVKSDGSISILSGFKKNELHTISKQLHFKNDTIKWQWAFRYQWIIPTK